MSGSEWYPPPGPATPPGQSAPPPGWAPPPPGWAPPRAPGWAPPQGPPPGMLGAAHKPGALPLRPLAIGDMYDAAFRIIRFNPKATVGSAVLSWTVDLSLDRSGGDVSGSDVAGMVGAFGSLGLGSVLQSIGLILVTGMIAHVTAAAAIGRRLSLGEAWRATHGKRWRLIGLTFLLGLMLTGIIAGYALTWVPVVMFAHGWQVASYGILTVPLFLCFLVWFWVRVYYLPVPALMLEPIGVTAAIG